MSKVIAIACDTEFTSFDKIGGDLLSVGLVEVLDDYTLGRSKVFYSRPRSTKYFTEAAQKVHGFSYFKASTFPEPKDAAIEILNWLAPLKDYFPLTFINHGNGKLDFKWLEQFMTNNSFQSSFWKAFNEDDVENTIALAKTHFTDIKESTEINPINGKPYGLHTLRNVADHCGLELDHHEALSDAIVCAQIYCRIKLGVGTFTGRLL